MNYLNFAYFYFKINTKTSKQLKSKQQTSFKPQNQQNE